MVDRFQVNRHDFRFRQGEVYVQEILFAHDNRAKADDVGVAGVEDHHVRAQLQQVGCNFITPDGIPHQPQRLLLRMAKQHAAGLAQAFGHRRHRVGAIAAVLAGGGFQQAHAGKFAVCRQQADILETLAAQQRAVGFVLDEHRQGFRDRGDRRLVPVIVMGMGDDHRVNVDDFIAGKRQRHQRVAQLAARGARKTRPGALVRQHRIDQKLFPGVFNNLGRVTDMGDVHVGVPQGG